MKRGVASGRIQTIDEAFGPVRRWDIHVIHPTTRARLGFRFIQPTTDRRRYAADIRDVDRHILDRAFRDIARHITGGHDETPPLWGPAAPLPAERSRPGMTTHDHHPTHVHAHADGATWIANERGTCERFIPVIASAILPTDPHHRLPTADAARTLDTYARDLTAAGLAPTYERALADLIAAITRTPSHPVPTPSPTPSPSRPTDPTDSTPSPRPPPLGGRGRMGTGSPDNHQPRPRPRPTRTDTP